MPDVDGILLWLECEGKELKELDQKETLADLVHVHFCGTLGCGPVLWVSILDTFSLFFRFCILGR